MNVWTQHGAAVHSNCQRVVGANDTLGWEGGRGVMTTLPVIGSHLVASLTGADTLIAAVY